MVHIVVVVVVYRVSWCGRGTVMEESVIAAEVQLTREVEVVERSCERVVLDVTGFSWRRFGRSHRVDKKFRER